MRFSGHLPEEEDITPESLATARQRRGANFLPFVTHSMETLERKEIMARNFGRSSVKLFDEQGLLNNGNLLFHAVHYSPEDCAIAAGHGVSLALCPLSNLQSGAGMAPVAEFLRHGVNTAIGVDYGQIEYWDNLRTALMHLNAAGVRRGAALTALRMATVNGARALGMGGTIGRLAPGYQADLVALRASPRDQFWLDLEGAGNAAFQLIMNTRPGNVADVMTAGEWRLRDGGSRNVDETALSARLNGMLARLWKRLAGRSAGD